MNIEQEILSIKKSVQRIEQNTRRKDKWVEAVWITSLTGWRGAKLRQAREGGLIECRRSESGSWEYSLNSIPEQFLLKEPLQKTKTRGVVNEKRAENANRIAALSAEKGLEKEYAHYEIK